jgi:hypothetical protein
MKKLIPKLLLTSLLFGCSLKVTHPQKGESVFNSHRPTPEMSESLKEDLIFCQNFSNEMLVKSGMRSYRDGHATIKDCLRRKGWQFY